MLSGEYIQMSGRAGRRGLDDKGIAIMMLDTELDENIAKGILQVRRLHTAVPRI